MKPIVTEALVQSQRLEFPLDNRKGTLFLKCNTDLLHRGNHPTITPAICISQREPGSFLHCKAKNELIQSGDRANILNLPCLCARGDRDRDREGQVCDEK